jgi:hypothetical protein
MLTPSIVMHSVTIKSIMLSVVKLNVVYAECGDAKEFVCLRKWVFKQGRCRNKKWHWTKSIQCFLSRICWTVPFWQFPLWLTYIWPGNTKRGKSHCTVDLLFDLYGISCMTTDNFCFYLQNRLIQTSQTGGQWYSDTSPFSISWFD